jgi:hypothetical protein
MAEWFSQHPHGVRFDWGLAGAAAHASSSSCLVIVDILSFTTSVTVAVEAGTRVFPYAWRDETGASFARQHQAQLAASHRTASADAPWSLSPAALRRAPFTARLVLPSPNGSAISAAASVNAGRTAACVPHSKTCSAPARRRRDRRRDQLMPRGACPHRPCVHCHHLTAVSFRDTNSLRISLPYAMAWLACGTVRIIRSSLIVRIHDCRNGHASGAELCEHPRPGRAGRNHRHQPRRGPNRSTRPGQLAGVRSEVIPIP